MIQFDGLLFSEDLLTKRVIKKRIGIRQAALEIGISPATLSRVENKKEPDVITLYKCLIWLNTPMNKYFKSEP